MRTYEYPCSRRSSFIGHQMADDQRRIGDVQNEAAKNAPAHMVLVEDPWCALFAQVTGERGLVVRICGQVKPHGKQSRDDVVDLDVQRLRVNLKFEFHLCLW